MVNALTLSYMFPAFLWISASACLFAVGDVVFRYWYQLESTAYFISGFAITCAALFCLAMSFPHQNIAVATIVCILLNITLYLILAYFIFGDVITIRQSIGLLLGFAAIYVLEGIK